MSSNSTLSFQNLLTLGYDLVLVLMKHMRKMRKKSISGELISAPCVCNLDNMHKKTTALQVNRLHLIQDFECQSAIKLCNVI